MAHRLDVTTVIMQNNEQRTLLIPPVLWVISLYFIEGLPFCLVNTVSVALFKTMQISNTQIGLFTSLFYIPWAIKFLWAPLIDYTGQRKKWIIATQVILAILTAVLSLSIFCSQSFVLLCILFTCMAFTSATYDIVCDGFYLDSLSKPEQSLYIGWRNTAYKVAWIFGAGFLVYIVGIIANTRIVHALSEFNLAWCVAFLIAAVVFAIVALFHNYGLPIANKSDNGQERHLLVATFKDAFTSFFNQKKIGLILIWILIFRSGDALLLKMAQPFLLDRLEKGGLALSLQSVGFIYGSLGMIFLLIGGIIGGWLVFKYGLKKCLLPSAILQSITLLLYWFLAVYKPGLPYIAMANGFEQFAYGLATAAYTSYLFTIVKSKFLASHYAIATGFMAIGMILPGAISGYLTDSFGYQYFFLISFFASLPGILCTLKLPFNTEN